LSQEEQSIRELSKYSNGIISEKSVEGDERSTKKGTK
jgi:hypothetical protein